MFEEWLTTHLSPKSRINQINFCSLTSESIHMTENSLIHLNFWRFSIEIHMKSEFNVIVFDADAVAASSVHLIWAVLFRLIVGKSRNLDNRHRWFGNSNFQWPSQYIHLYASFREIRRYFKQSVWSIHFSLFRQRFYFMFVAFQPTKVHKTVQQKRFRQSNGKLHYKKKRRPNATIIIVVEFEFDARLKENFCENSIKIKTTWKIEIEMQRGRDEMESVCTWIHNVYAILCAWQFVEMQSRQRNRDWKRRTAQSMWELISKGYLRKNRVCIRLKWKVMWCEKVCS